MILAWEDVPNANEVNVIETYLFLLGENEKVNDRLYELLAENLSLLNHKKIIETDNVSQINTI